MYIDTILFIIGGVCAMLALILVIYLIASRKKSRSYRSVLKQETELLTTTSLTSNLSQRRQGDNPSAEDREKQREGQSMPQNLTGSPEEAGTELLAEDPLDTPDFDIPALAGQYIIKSELHRSRISQVFLAQSVKLGNLWVVKYVPKQSGQLANEENILKLLNHISLPKIIDIFQDANGTYLVESFIEGSSLDKLLKDGEKINQSIIIDWAEQIAQVLNYLHNMESCPICHLDLKPANIMLTHDNRLVLIDFGISKRFGQDDVVTTGLTYKYAAPEQIKYNVPNKHLPLIARRFGELPPDWLYWLPDVRTDIYSLGVILFEFAMGEIPTLQNIAALKNMVSDDLSAIISKCLALDPLERYQSVGDLLADLQKIKNSKIKMAKSLLMRKAAALTAACAIVFSGGSFAGGYHIYGQENMALLGIRPGFVNLSIQQSSELNVNKQFPDGKIVSLDNTQVSWSFSEDNIARVDGNRILGINPGETELCGQYRNKAVKLKVRVVEPIDGMVNISQRYQAGYLVQLFAGTLEREQKDGIPDEAEFVSPASIAITEAGTVYLADSGYLRKIQDGRVETVMMEPDYLTPRIIRCSQNEVYVLTDEWEDDNGAYYGLLKMTDGLQESLYTADANYTAVDDFACFDGLIYFLDRNIAIGGTFLKTLSLSDPGEINTVCELPENISALTLDDEGKVYLADSKAAVIYVWREDQLSYFTGIRGEKAFIDGKAPLFYLPQRIKWADDSLFIWDFNVLRRITAKNSVAGECQTLAGEASPDFEQEIIKKAQAAQEMIFPNSKQTDFAVTADGILISDPKRGVIWQLR